LAARDLNIPKVVGPQLHFEPPKQPVYAPEIFLSYLNSKISVIQQFLEERVILASNDSPAKALIDAMKYALLGPGKRIRPILAIAACEMFDGSIDSVLPAAIAIEMIHTMSLVHDNLPVMDNDDLRRGRLTTHKVFGEQIAILAGDALLAEAFGVVARNNTIKDPSRTLEIISRISKAASYDGLAGGQVRDLECERKPKESVSMKDLQWIHVHKTAVLLNCAISCGAIAGGAQPEDVIRLENFANLIGLAYQIVDDILDVTGTTDVLGKTAGKDLAAEKATYPSLIGLQESRNLAARLIDEAKECLSPYQDRAIVLLSIADFILARNS